MFNASEPTHLHLCEGDLIKSFICANLLKYRFSQCMSNYSISKL
jgi:hypothetical protein